MIAADDLGWPVALKTSDEFLRNRLDLGGVILNINSAQHLRESIEQMTEQLAPYPQSSLEIQSMASAGQACVVKAQEDPLLGPVLSFGVAGDATDLLEDWAHRVPPLTLEEVKEWVWEPKAAKKLAGYQGVLTVNETALADMLMRLAALKDQLPQVVTVDFSPVLVGQEATVLQCSIHLGNAQQRTDSARRAMRD